MDRHRDLGRPPRKHRLGEIPLRVIPGGKKHDLTVITIGAAMARRVEQRRDENEARLSADSLSTAAASWRTGASERHIQRLVEQAEALSLTHNNQLLLPPWQLQENAIKPIIPGTIEVFRLFPSNLTSLHAWMTKPNSDFDGNTPAEVMAEPGGVDLVICLVEAIGASGR